MNFFGQQIPMQVDLGNVLVAAVTVVVIFASLSQSRRQIKHADQLARREREDRDHKQLVREVADFIFELRLAGGAVTDESRAAHVSALRRAEYLKLYLAPDDDLENKIRDLVHEATFILTGDGEDRNHFATVSKLSTAVRNYVRRNHSQ